MLGPLWGGGFVPAFLQLVALYYPAGLLLHCVAPRLLPVKGVQVAPRNEGDVWRDAVTSLGTFCLSRRRAVISRLPLSHPNFTTLKNKNRPDRRQGRDLGARRAPARGRPHAPVRRPDRRRVGRGVHRRHDRRAGLFARRLVLLDAPPAALAAALPLGALGAPPVSLFGCFLLCFCFVVCSFESSTSTQNNQLWLSTTKSPPSDNPLSTQHVLSTPTNTHSPRRLPQTTSLSTKNPPPSSPPRLPPPKKQTKPKKQKLARRRRRRSRATRSTSPRRRSCLATRCSSRSRCRCT